MSNLFMFSAYTDIRNPHYFIRAEFKILPTMRAFVHRQYNITYYCLLIEILHGTLQGCVQIAAVTDQSVTIMVNSCKQIYVTGPLLCSNVHGTDSFSIASL